MAGYDCGGGLCGVCGGKDGGGVVEGEEVGVRRDGKGVFGRVWRG